MSALDDHFAEGLRMSYRLNLEQERKRDELHIIQVGFKFHVLKGYLDLGANDCFTTALNLNKLEEGFNLEEMYVDDLNLITSTHAKHKHKLPKHLKLRIDQYCANGLEVCAIGHSRFLGRNDYNDYLNFNYQNYLSKYNQAQSLNIEHENTLKTVFKVNIDILAFFFNTSVQAVKKDRINTDGLIKRLITKAHYT